MTVLLLVVIYLSFISLGLPDSLLGAAWPTMQQSLSVPISRAGWLSMIISAGTVISSLFSAKLLRRFGTGPVVSCSVLLTAAALFGFSVSSGFPMLCLAAVPYGLGAGAVDAALNHHVAVHYAARHMSWLHCFWGVGAAMSPYIMSFFLRQDGNWQGGYRAVSVIQICLTLVLFASLPLWKRSDGTETQDTEQAAAPLPMCALLRQRGVRQVLTAFFCYCALESTAGLWASSFLVYERGVGIQTAARFASLFYIGITAGRFICGFVSERLGDRGMIRLGLLGIAAGVTLLLLPLPCGFALAGLVTVGLGCAPIYPSQIHATPAVFGRAHAQALIGMQMASAYIGTTLMPPLFGVIADRAGLQMFPLFLMMFLVLMAMLTEQVHGKPQTDCKKTEAHT
ncbi:MAG: MFS transporter [Oscillospiraceae bacterium]|nr:MFS transporter [Oscillospiraceae bacterium]